MSQVASYVGGLSPWASGMVDSLVWEDVERVLEPLQKPFRKLVKIVYP